MPYWIAYLKIPGVQGDSKEKNHIGWIQLEAFSWPEMRPAMVGIGVGGSPKLTLMEIMKVYDSSSARLFKSGVDGTRFESAVLEVVIVDGKQSSVAQRHTMTDVIVSSFQMSGTDLESRKPFEIVVLDFKSLKSENLRAPGKPKAGK